MATACPQSWPFKNEAGQKEQKQRTFSPPASVKTISAILATVIEQVRNDYNFRPVFALRIFFQMRRIVSTLECARNLQEMYSTGKRTSLLKHLDQKQSN